jgi:predicted metal-dependent hydrolase
MTRVQESINKYGIEIQQDTFDVEYFTSVYGYCGRRHGRYIFINLDRHNNDNDLHHSDIRRLMVHELVHYRFPDLKHGTEFYCTIELIFSQGKKYPKVHIPCPNVPMI